MRRILIILGVISGSVCLQAEVEDPGWPRLYTTDNHRVVVYHPQIESWEDRTNLSARAVVAVSPNGADETVYGVLHLEFSTSIDFDARTVLLRKRRPIEPRFPDLEPDDAAKLVAIVTEALPHERELLYSLDRLLAAFDASRQPRRTVEVNLEPPPIFFSESPAILVMFRGDPEFQPVTGTDLLYASNTNWDLFLEPVSSRYFLLNGETWLTSPHIRQGPWTPASDLPISLWKLPKDESWADVRRQIPGKKSESVPIVFVTTMPAELIVTDGEPVYEPIPGTQLLYVSNTDGDLFLHAKERRHYFLAAGRWFRSETVDGPWSAATTDLPRDFARIPEGHLRDRVLVSVPGTGQAEDAIFLASIPRKATVNRKAATLEVAYEGAPDFILIDGTEEVYHAPNTPCDVFRVKESYYCCYQGVWFISASATGPWAVCDVVPEVIYAIPPSSPAHHVTYVRVYESTPDTVVVGYTSGYVGEYIAYGALLFGAGYYLYRQQPYEQYHYGAHYFSYGCRARYSYYYGGFYRSAHRYGPYGGAGRWSVYDPRAGAFSRGALRYGPRDGECAREAYNPYRERYSVRVTSNRYGAWGHTVVESDDAWARGRHRSGPPGAGAGRETSRGATDPAIAGGLGKEFNVVKTRDGDLYVGPDGNVYRRKDGRWQRREGGAWVAASPSTSASAAERESPARASDRALSEASLYGHLDRESRMRRRGDDRAGDFESYFSTYGGSRVREFERRGRERAGFGEQ